MIEPSTSTSRPVLSVVVPVLNEQDGLNALRERIDAALGAVTGGYEIVYVDDGSTDRSAEIISGWTADDERVVLVQLSRNFGMDIAMSAGMDHTRGAFVVLMHADLQDPPELVPKMLKLAREGAEVVYARRIGRDESRLKRLLATAFYAMMRRLARVPYQGQAGDFRLMSRQIVDTVRAMPERRRFLRGMVAWVGFEQVPIEYQRADRASGRGASYPALFRLALEALTSFSDVPLNLATYLGAFAATVSALAGLIVLLLTILSAIHATIGVWLLVVVLFLGGVQLMSVGVLGRYLAHVHDQVLERPLYLTSRVISKRGEAVGTGGPTAGERVPQAMPTLDRTSSVAP